MAPRETLADLAGLSKDDEAFRQLIAAVGLLIKDHQNGRKAQAARGRPSAKPLNDLIAAIALAFQDRSTWTCADASVYRSFLTEFLVRVLVAHRIFPTPRQLGRLIPPPLRVPKA